MLQPDLPTEPFLLGNQWIDPDYHIPLGFAEPTEYGVFWQEWNGLRYYWLTPEERHQQWWEQEASKHFVACKRVPVRKIKWLPEKFLNQIVDKVDRACCKDTRAHDIEAFYSSEFDKQRGAPDIYVLHCKCGRKHRRFCVGGGKEAPRPIWEIR